VTDELANGEVIEPFVEWKRNGRHSRDYSSVDASSPARLRAAMNSERSVGRPVSSCLSARHRLFDFLATRTPPRMSIGLGYSPERSPAGPPVT
jgi:hypothetical protein